ncbi:LTA synthase family protein [Tahibacter amnicola]|uniref:Sulfatase-like hydrolase/transferase n=1 Tax=Tahibacter amnicola TaxID=2976241 RepID=A0ABY6BG14_9GAMM|nr:sulfatase-like hydrolase/transferase [Tahibacter amnicola]UXI66807.1 sulfatase-like hydrolase/transferase [Tahibacter amnicola]
MAMPLLPVIDRRSWLLHLLAIIAYGAMVLYGPLAEGTPEERTYTLVLSGSVALLAAFTTRRFAFSLIASAGLFILILTSSVLKVTYLTTPLLAPDLVYFANLETLEVFARYPLILIASFAGLVALPLSLGGIWRIDRPRLFSGLRRWPRIVVLSLGAGLSAVALFATLNPRGPFMHVYGKGMWAAMNDKSYLTDFFISFYATQIEPPKLVKDAASRQVWNEQVASVGDPRQRPDIVAVLQESTFDPSMLVECRLPVCKRRLFQVDKRTRAHGLLQVHTWGGGTWTSEFAFLTSMAHVLFGNAGLYAPFNLAPRVAYSLPRALKENGYRTIAIYPMSGSFINARNAYNFYGFDTFYDGTTYGLGWDSNDFDLLKVFNRIYEDEKRAHSTQPLFIFMLTLHQHGPHMTPLRDLPSPYNKPLFPKRLNPWLNLNLGNYLERLEQSEQAMAQLEQKLFASDRRTVLMHFGDHQPSFDGAINALEKKVPKGVKDPTKVTYYMLKSNFPLRRKIDFPVLDIIYLGSLLLDVADLRKDDFYEASALLRDRCEGRYFDCKEPALLESYHDYVFGTIGALRE